MRLLTHFFGFCRNIFQRLGLLSPDKAIPAKETKLYSRFLGRDVELLIFEPLEEIRSQTPWSLLILNDAQDLEEVKLGKYLYKGQEEKSLPPILAVGSFPKDRMNEYGTASQPDYKNRGNLAAAFSKFVILELLPYLRSTYPISTQAHQVAFAGFSLGGLSAFDLVWEHPYHIGIAGVFSGALWWRSAPFKEDDPDADRIVHDYVVLKKSPAHARFWFQTGTNDETSDRNKNGIIDAIDDTTDLMKALKHSGTPESQIKYLEIEGGEHHPPTWAEAMPDFLSWAFGTTKPDQENDHQSSHRQS